MFTLDFPHILQEDCEHISIYVMNDTLKNNHRDNAAASEVNTQSADVSVSVYVAL